MSATASFCIECTRPPRVSYLCISFSMKSIKQQHDDSQIHYFFYRRTNFAHIFPVRVETIRWLQTLFLSNFRTTRLETSRTIYQLIFFEVVAKCVSKSKKYNQKWHHWGYTPHIAKYSILPASVWDSDVSQPIPASKDLAKIFRDGTRRPSKLLTQPFTISERVTCTGFNDKTETERSKSPNFTNYNNFWASFSWPLENHFWSAALDFDRDYQVSSEKSNFL
jgi:hypothetical protein